MVGLIVGIIRDTVGIRVIVDIVVGMIVGTKAYIRCNGR